MSDGADSHNSVDPMELWRQWSETQSQMWTSSLERSKELYSDPNSFYGSWLKNVEELQEQLKANPTLSMNPKEMWQTWFSATMDIWRQAASAGGDPLGLMTQWVKMMEEAQARLQAGEILPVDPFTMFRDWYNATSDQWAKVVEEVIGSDKFLEATSPFLESYTSITKAFRRASEEYFKKLQLPTISDVARVAELVIALEEKVDKIEDAFEQFQDAYTSVATVETIAHLEKRLDQAVGNLSAQLDQTATSERVVHLEQRLDQAVGNLSTQLGQVATVERVAQLGQRLDQTEGKLSTQLGQTATVERVVHLERRLDQVEGKLDKILALLEQQETNVPAQSSVSIEATSSKPPRKTPKKNVVQQEA